MYYVIVLIFFPFYLAAAPVYDFWDNSKNTNNKNRVEVKNTNLPRVEYQKDSIKPNLADDLNKEKIKLADDQKDITVKDRYLRYNLRGEKNPQIAKDFDPKQIKLAPDYMDYSSLPANKKIKKVNKNNISNNKNQSSSEKILSNKTKQNQGYQDNYVVFYDENDREEGFIDIIPYITIGNSLFEISQGEYSARVLDDSISASITLDLGLNYIWDNANVGYLWNINLGTYDFNEKDRTNKNAQSKGEISGYIVSVMPTIFYELNRAQTMSVLIGYGVGTSYIKLDGSATLANSSDQTVTNDILIENFYLSHGLLIEILHNNLMVSFTKVKMRLEENNQNIKINENRLNLGYKFSF